MLVPVGKLIFICFATLVLASGANAIEFGANSQSSCLKLLVKNMAEQGLSSIERRQKLSTPLDTDTIQASFAEASRSGRPVFLTELRSDVRWSMAVVSAVENDLTAKLDPHAMSDFHEYAQTLKARLSELLKKDQGVGFYDWTNLGEFLSKFIGYNSSAPSTVEFFQRQGHVAKDLNRLKETPTGASSDLDLTLQMQIYPTHKEGWHIIVTMRHLDIPDLDEWMSKGFSSAGLIEKSKKYDGNQEGHPENYYHHDLGHFKFFGLRRTGTTLSSEDYFREFRRKLTKDSKITSETLRKTIQARWHWVYHENDWSSGLYGPETLKKILWPSFHTVPQFLRRLRPNDIGDFFHGGYPDRATVENADQWLMQFAEEILLKYKLSTQYQFVKGFSSVVGSTRVLNGG